MFKVIYMSYLFNYFYNLEVWYNIWYILKINVNSELCVFQGCRNKFGMYLPFQI